VGFTLAGAILLWEMATRVFGISKIVLPAPTAVVQEMLKVYFLLPAHILATMIAILAGFVAAAVIGILVGVLVAASDYLRGVLFPIIVTIQIVPKIALAPLVLIWFGFGLSSKVAISFLIAFFPILVNTLSGLMSVEPELIDLVRGIRGTKRQVFTKIRLPAALPHIFAGLKISITLAVVGATVGEFIGSERGLGYLIILSEAELNTPLMFTAIAALAALGLAMYGLVLLFERLIIPWHVAQQDIVREISSGEGA
jgi:NitT/TauT family transport system permease protein